jgi:hypothetical protein
MPVLRKRKFKRNNKVCKKENIDCPICFENIKNEEITTTNKCLHKFCLACIKEWSKTKETCPLCRSIYEWLIISETKETIFVKKSEEIEIVYIIAENILNMQNILDNVIF